MPTDLIPTAEAAETIGCTPSALSRWVAAGRITPAHKLPGRTGPFLFTPAEVQRVKTLYAGEHTAARTARSEGASSAEIRQGLAS